MRRVSIGIDIGGTNSKYGIVDAVGQVLFHDTVATTDYPEISRFVKALHSLTERAKKQIKDDLQFIGVGIGAPNGNYYKGTIEQAPNLIWKGVIHLKDLFHDEFGLPSVITNDANAAAIGEMIYGGAKGMNDFIVITLGTGLGSGLVANGQLINGHDGFAGELGHTRVKLNGRICGCGRRGCLETYASATGLKRTVYKLLSDTLEPSRLRDVPFNDLSAKIVSEAADAGDLIALEAFEYTGMILGQALSDAVAYTSPEAIFLFGGLVNAGEYLFAPTRKHFERNLLDIYKNKIKILPSELNETHGAILGASALAWKEFGN